MPNLLLLLFLLLFILTPTLSLHYHLTLPVAVRRNFGRPDSYFIGDRVYQYQGPFRLNCNNGMPVTCTSKLQCDTLIRVYAEHCKTITAGSVNDRG
jgi:hypothetical protein